MVSQFPAPLFDEEGNLNGPAQQRADTIEACTTALRALQSLELTCLDLREERFATEIRAIAEQIHHGLRFLATMSAAS